MAYGEVKRVFGGESVMSGRAITQTEFKYARDHAYGIYGDLLQLPCDIDALTFSLWVTLTYHLVRTGGWAPGELLDQLLLHAHKASAEGEA